MDRKDRLYEGLGHIAASGKREAPDEEKPRTVPEQLIDYRLQRKSDKKVRADVYAHRARLIHGQDSTPHTPSVRHGAVESVLGATIDREHSHSFGQVVRGNVMRLFEGPDIRGYTPLKRKLEKAKVIGRVATARVTAAEARKKWVDVNAEQMKLGNKMHKRTRRKQRKHNERVSIVAEEPLRKEWRDRRRQRAQATIGRIDRRETYLQRGAERIYWMSDDVAGSAQALGQEIIERHYESWDMTKEQAERLANASVRAGKFVVHETVATTQTAVKGGKYTANFYAEVARGAANIYWGAAKYAAGQATKGAHSAATKTKSKIARKK